MRNFKAQFRDQTPNEKLDVLMLSEKSMWPHDQGFRVHGCQIIKAMRELCINAKIASIENTDNAPTWLSEMLVPWEQSQESDYRSFIEGWSGRWLKLREKVANHQGIDVEQYAGAIRLIKRHKPKAVIALGLHGSIMLKGLQQAFPRVKMIWYAADEPVTFHLSCIKHEPISQWKNRFRNIALFGLIERLFSKGLDGAIGVSPHDSKRLRLIGGIKSCATIRNGVDLNKFTVEPYSAKSRSIVFWGRMDFEPNIDAVKWFAKEVWPNLIRRSPNATFKIVGKNPTNQVLQLNNIKGIEVTGEVDDVRPYARDAAVTILPMRCGAGIKNKLLEAAAMGLSIIATDHAIQGLEISRFEKPFIIANKANDWVEQIWGLWNNPIRQKTMRDQARQWVERRHHWKTAATQLVEYINPMLPLDEQMIIENSHQTTMDKTDRQKIREYRNRRAA
ncbi:glycosyltransferase [Planctomycetota bacterium]|nr:glycosyltransferase [Planctomycetota bacterium]